MRKTDDSPPGFARLEDASCTFNFLLVPTWLKQEISAARDARRKEEVAEAEEQRKNFLSERLLNQGKKAGIGEVDVRAEEQELRDSEQEHPASEEIAVYAPDEPLKMVRRAKQSTPDRDRIAQLEGLYVKLKELGPYRTFAPCLHWRLALARLDQTHPHFSEVTQVVRHRLTLAEQTLKPAQIPPLLLLGMAGVGKTHYAKSLAAAIGTSHRQLQLDAGLTDAALIGNDKRWANTAYGVLFEEVVLGEHANPVIVLDEIDKSLRDKRSDPLAPLHSLLERGTSSHTTDVSLEFNFDASNIIWIATANYPWLIPQPLRTRMKEFTIGFPTPAQSIQIAREVAQKAIEEIAPTGFEPAGREVGSMLGHLTAREVYQAVSDAIAHAVTAGRLRLERSDFSADIRFDDEEPSGWLH